MTTATKPISRISERSFETMRENDRMQGNHGYIVIDEFGFKTYAWSPDGVGCYWYETLEELEDNHI